MAYFDPNQSESRIQCTWQLSTNQKAGFQETWRTSFHKINLHIQDGGTLESESQPCKKIGNWQRSCSCCRPWWIQLKKVRWIGWLCRVVAKQAGTMISWGYRRCGDFDIWHFGTRNSFFWAEWSLKECLQALPPSPFLSRILVAADPACCPLAFLIVLTDREPGTGYV